MIAFNNYRSLPRSNYSESVFVFKAGVIWDSEHAIFLIIVAFDVRIHSHVRHMGIYKNVRQWPNSSFLRRGEIQFEFSWDPRWKAYTCEENSYSSLCSVPKCLSLRGWTAIALRAKWIRFANTFVFPVNVYFFDNCEYQINYIGEKLCSPVETIQNMMVLATITQMNASVLTGDQISSSFQKSNKIIRDKKISSLTISRSWSLISFIGRIEKWTSIYVTWINANTIMELNRVVSGRRNTKLIRSQIPTCISHSESPQIEQHHLDFMNFLWT